MKSRLLILSMLMLLFSSCKKWLDVDLINQVDENKLFAKEQGFVDALAGAYNQMAEPNLYGQKLSYELLDVLAQYYSYNSMAESYKPYRDYNYKDATLRKQIDGIWSDMYSTIASVNNIIRWEQKNGVVMRPNIRKQVLGEALALRAYLHFDLMRMFCADIKFNHQATGIPYNKQFGVALPPVYTLAECYQLVLGDLEAAWTNLNEADPINATTPYLSQDKNMADRDVARMNKYAIRALMARVYLTKGDKENATRYAKEVIAANKFRLLDFKTGIDVDESKKDIRFSDEHIFSLRNKNIPEQSNAVHFEVKTETSTTAAKLPFGDAPGIYNANSDDTRYQLWFDLGKFTKYTRGNVKVFTPKIPLIKLAEMYLILTEALYDTDRNQSLQYLNTLRRSRIRNVSDWFFLTRDNILDEMIREYPGEGQLFFAYKRLNKAIRNTSGTGDIPPSNSLFVFPIPDKETETGHR
ncbi:RagB/SusD family nutrient uptake outer membrane protein [Chitinophaga nivalis]|uniref:RagB/SusD family nutrient uptake outer membrane protein n=1 Tax=Chitinophaga nivalis TaxID=2991709 RepID=A0ABT3IJM8_9BACT|nr:RagB/SusD family nutrient uptake outer membrane protein [Chitinophaga nivalis]MCW3466138.1 RagB/SusD family nutrient uptake outer membrane protein [Chitinophaga nivalis]MCW3484171.1 RagB/SusD family nutrient uptake outer membrane protein [Chitinophaga nivalis]